MLSFLASYGFASVAATSCVVANIALWLTVRKMRKALTTVGRQLHDLQNTVGGMKLHESLLEHVRQQGEG